MYLSIDIDVSEIFPSFFSSLSHFGDSQTIYVTDPSSLSLSIQQDHSNRIRRWETCSPDKAKKGYIPYHNGFCSRSFFRLVTIQHLSL